LGGPAWYSPSTFSDGRIYQGDDTGLVSAFAARTGQVLWQRPLGSGVRARPVLVEPGLLAVPTAGGRLFLLEADTGMERDSLDLGGPAFGGATAAAGGVLVGARDASVRFVAVQR